MARARSDCCSAPGPPMLLVNQRIPATSPTTKRARNPRPIRKLIPIAATIHPPIIPLAPHMPEQSIPTSRPGGVGSRRWRHRSASRAHPTPARRPVPSGRSARYWDAPRRRTACALLVEQERKRDPELAGELPDNPGVFAQIDPDNLEPLSREPLAERHLCGSLPQAFRSRGREEAEQDHLALELVGELHAPPVQLGQGERCAGLHLEKSLGAQRLERIGGATRRRNGPDDHERAERKRYESLPHRSLPLMTRPAASAGSVGVPRASLDHRFGDRRGFVPCGQRERSARGALRGSSIRAL